MTIFTCEDTFEGMMTCIYDAWNSRLGHKNVRLLTEPIGNYELFCNYQHIDPDPVKVEKVIRSVRQKISYDAYFIIYRTAMSFRQEKLDAIYRFMILGFASGPAVTQMLSEDSVTAIFEIDRKVSNEAHLFREFTRFSNMKGNILVSHIEPKCNIITLLAPQFSDRMPSENWMIIDKNRNIAVVHPADTDYYLTALSEKEIQHLETHSETDDPYVGLWKGFFATIGIDARKNARCQRNMLPLWYRKNMTEFNH